MKSCDEQCYAVDANCYATMFILLYTGLGMRDVEVRVQFDGVENDYWSYNCEHWRNNRDDSEHRYDTEIMMQLDPYRNAD